MAHQTIEDSEKAEYNNITLKCGYVKEQGFRKPVLISAMYNGENLFEKIGQTCFDIKFKDNSTGNLEEIIFEFCEATFRFKNKDFKLRSQHSLLEYKEKTAEITYPINLTLFLTPYIEKEIRKWEVKNESKYPKGYQKGTGYFWLAENEFSNKRFDKGFLFLALAISEDMKIIPTEYQNQGGFLAASLVYEKKEKIAGGEKHYVHNSVQLKPVIDKLKEIFDDFNSNYDAKYQYSEFVEKFLLNDDIKVEFFKICFTRAFTHICDYILYFDNYYFDNPLTTSILFQPIFNLAVLFEEMLKHKSSSTNFSLNNEIKNIVKDTSRSWISESDYNNLNNQNSGVYKKGWENDSDFHIKFNDAIDLNFGSVSISDKQASILITAKILRNLGAHRILKEVIPNKETLEKILTILSHAIIIIVKELYNSP